MNTQIQESTNVTNEIQKPPSIPPGTLVGADHEDYVHPRLHLFQGLPFTLANRVDDHLYHPIVAFGHHVFNGRETNHVRILAMGRCAQSQLAELRRPDGLAPVWFLRLPVNLGWH